MIFITLIFIILVSIIIESISCSKNSQMKINCINHSVEDGLYYGKIGGFFPPTVVFINVENENAFAEFYQPLKGQIVKVLLDTLKKSTASEEVLYSGKDTIIICKGKKLLIKPKNESAHFDFDFRSILIKLNPEKINEMNEFQNLAYLRDDYIETLKYFNSCKECSKTSDYWYERFQNKYKVYELVGKMTHEEFLKEYPKMKKRILEEIRNIKPTSN